MTNQIRVGLQNNLNVLIVIIAIAICLYAATRGGAPHGTELFLPNRVQRDKLLLVNDSGDIKPMSMKALNDAMETRARQWANYAITKFRK